MTDEKRLPVWPLADEYYEGDAVAVLTDRFGDVVGSHLGFDPEPIARVIAHRDYDSASLLLMDAITGAERVLRALSDPNPDADTIASSSFYFGAAFALASLEENGVFDSAGAQAWLRRRQAEGGERKAEPRWKALAWARASSLWASDALKTSTQVADEVHAWLGSADAWGGLPSDRPARAETVRRYLQRQRRLTDERPEVLEDGPKVAGRRDA